MHLPVVGEIGAGTAHCSRCPGTAVKIMTGAPVPAGADTVVPYEWTDRGVAQVRIDRAPDLGQHVRRAGEDVEKGDPSSSTARCSARGTSGCWPRWAGRPSGPVPGRGS
ncbi:hypothetical protein [Nocardioides ungokensis]|uniref:hypothetical protein n=1 Tax=Nocardioides ungokensis TaxID=1643322 RepID=UPI001FE856CA|nr:hypothetical protein [Nocardioides ungokensis]